MKRLKLFAPFSLLLVTFMFLPGCIGQEEEPPATVTETATETAIQTATEVKTVTPETTPGVTNPYIGSGKLDGEGIPLNFFTDKDVRLAFAYAIDYEAIINDASLGSAVYTPTPILSTAPISDDSQKLKINGSGNTFRQFIKDSF